METKFQSSVSQPSACITEELERPAPNLISNDSTQETHLTTPNKALLLDINVSVADNNIRRAVSSFSLNFASQSDAESMLTFFMTPNSSRTVASPLAVTSATLLRTSQPLDVVVTFRDSSTLTKRVQKLLFLDSDVMSIAMTAVASNENDARVTLLQG